MLPKTEAIACMTLKRVSMSRLSYWASDRIWYTAQFFVVHLVLKVGRYVTAGSEFIFPIGSTRLVSEVQVEESWTNSHELISIFLESPREHGSCIETVVGPIMGSLYKTLYPHLIWPYHPL